MSIYTSDEARDRVLDLYERRLASLPHLESRYIDTPLARTHVLETGQRDAPPLVIVHGANGDALAMAPFTELDDTYRCILVDVPGEPTRSAEVTLEGPQFGEWMGSLLDGLGLERAHLLGMSGGGYVVLQTCAVHPSRVDKAVLLVPQGIVRIGAIPEATPANARALVEAITAPDPGFPSMMVDMVVEQMKLYFECLTSPFHDRDPLADDALQNLEAPVLLFAGDADAIFPGEALIERAERIIPTLAETILMTDVNHVNARLVGAEVTSRIREFLAG